MAGLSLELKGITVSLGTKELFKDFFLKIEPGESFVIVGPSGTGKSTLLKVFAGLISIKKGDYFIDNKNIAMMSSEVKSKTFRQFGMLFQKNALFDSLTVEENITFPLVESGVRDKQKLSEIVDKYVNFVGLFESKQLYPHEISGGMQKRLGIARALALNPSTILYDDPTAGLDPVTSRKIVQLLIDFKKQNQATIITVTNDMNRALQMADRVGFCFENEFLLTGNVSETKNHSNPKVKQFIEGNIRGPISFVDGH